MGAGKEHIFCFTFSVGRLVGVVMELTNLTNKQAYPFVTLPSPPHPWQTNDATERRLLRIVLEWCVMPHDHSFGLMKKECHCLQLLWASVYLWGWCSCWWFLADLPDSFVILIVFALSLAKVLSRQTHLLWQNTSFVMTKVCLLWQNFCHDKHIFVNKFITANIILLQQNICRDKLTFVMTNVFVVTKHVFCHDKHNFVTTNFATSLLLSWQTCVCHDKTHLLSWQKYACHDKSLLQQKSYFWRLLPMILLCFCGMTMYIVTHIGNGSWPSNCLFWQHDLVRFLWFSIGAQSSNILTLWWLFLSGLPVTVFLVCCNGNTV